MKGRLLVLLAVLAAVGIAVWLGRSREIERNSGKQDPVVYQDTAGGESSPAKAGKENRSGTERPGEAAADSAMMNQPEIMQVIQEILGAMRGGRPDEIERGLARLDEVFGNATNRDPSIKAILEFLKTGADAGTGMGFVIGEGGVLEDATTLRVYLMDQLGRLCRESGGGEAADVARQVLSGFGSVDEWAISMRNVAWSDPTSTAYLDEKVNAMLNHPQWREQPTTGMLEAFDVIVHTGSMTAVPQLAREISLERSALGRASGVALDRLASSHSQELMTLLNQQPELLAVTPLVRADLFAHADLSVPEQRAQVEIYLLRPDVHGAERGKLFSSLIQTGQFLSHNLITPYVSPEDPDHAVERLGTLVETVNGWMRDGRFQPLNGELSELGETVNNILDEISADEEAGEQK